MRQPGARQLSRIREVASTGYRSPSVLDKPFSEVVEEMGLGKRFTQRGLRGPSTTWRAPRGSMRS